MTRRGPGDPEPLRATTRRATTQRAAVLPEGDTEHDLGALLGLISAGDADAFEALYRRVAELVHGVALKVLRNQAHAEEITHDVFVHIWQHARKFAGDRGSPVSWIMMIAHHRAVDRVRHERASAERDIRDAELGLQRPYDQVADAVETHWEHTQVRACLGQLSDLQRQCVLMAYFDGYSYPEIARKLDTPLGTIKTRMRDAMRRLRDCAHDHG